ncbi:MAG TPA: hypothetical protein VFJ01_03050 [Oleiagrimonas sp.]|nr:hypothetical protein [Oleiagrimonas sp.]
MTSTPATRIQDRVRELYRRAGPQIDVATAARLRAARRKALENPSSTQQRHLRWMVPTGACAMVALAMLTIWQPLHRPAPVATTTPALSQSASTDVLPPDADQADPSLYQNMDFYAWLASQPVAKSGQRH